VLVSNVYPKFGFASAGPGITATSVRDYFDRRRDIRSFAEQALYRRASLTLGMPDGVERVNALRATPSFYRLLGATAYAGRAIAEEDGTLGNTARIVLSYVLAAALRRRSRDRRPTSVSTDRHIASSESSHATRVPLDDIDLWLLAAFNADQQSDASRHSNNWVMIARLERGASVERAQRESTR
jgi:hypothetical protein